MTIEIRVGLADTRDHELLYVVLFVRDMLRNGSAARYAAVSAPYLKTNSPDDGNCLGSSMALSADLIDAGWSGINEATCVVIAYVTSDDMKGWHSWIEVDGTVVIDAAEAVVHVWKKDDYFEHYQPQHIHSTSPLEAVAVVDALMAKKDTFIDF
jgi:hypothetical protein